MWRKNDDKDKDKEKEKSDKADNENDKIQNNDNNNQNNQNMIRPSPSNLPLNSVAPSYIPMQPSYNIPMQSSSVGNLLPNNLRSSGQKQL